MQTKYLRWLRYYIRRSKNRKVLRKVVQAMACVVVFCTTYALILPAITLEQNTVCGLEEHTHGESCYEQHMEAVILCQPEGLTVHSHADTCFNTAGTRICPLPEVVEHIHNLECYIYPAHDHSEECFREDQLICGMEENDDPPILVCGREEIILHTHTEACLDEGGNPVCGLEEVSEHSHGAECFGFLPGEQLLICDLQEHTHSESCHASADEETETGETEATKPIRITRQKETENYIVTVSYSSDLVLPPDADLRVTEYPRDSEIFRQRCEEAGYELEWLLNIGFFQGETELNLDGAFDVVVTSKEGKPLGTDVTHFSDTGTEHIPGDPGEGEDGSSVAFSSDGFSDFGGGVAPAAASATVNLNIMAWGNPIQFAGGNTVNCQVGSTVTLKIGTQQCNYVQPSVNVNGGELVSLTTTCDYGHRHNAYDWCTGNLTHTVVIRVTASNVSVTGVIEGGSWTTMTVHVDSSGSGGGETPDPGPGEDPEIPDVPTVPSYPYHPHAVHTGSVDISRLRFYNVCENGDKGVGALAGCVFEIKGDNGYERTVTSGNKPEVNLPNDIPDGVYTITEIYTPPGYMRDTRFERTFTIKNGTLAATNNIGTFVNHNIEQLEAGKTAEVEDYNNRIYQILLMAESSARLYEMGPIDVLFVVDQSNSMLFPSGLVPTGKSVTLRLDGWDNVRNMENLGLDKNQMYYIISDPNGTSTVWCIWYNGHSWMYQDASYYAKAKHNNGEGYQTPGELAIFPENRSYNDQRNAEASGTRSNGGGLGYNLSGSGLGKHLDTASNDTITYQVYTATDEYNRLHYLEEALSNMIYELADANAENRVTLTGFTKEVNEADCIGPLKLTPENANILVSAVNSINTSGGTRQDIALKHVHEQHLTNTSDGYSGDPDYTYTILITDGAPVLSGGSDLNNLGSPNDAPSTTADSVYAQIKGYAALVRQNSSLMTVSLGMGSVDAGRSVLQQIASDGDFFCAMDDASDLVQNMQALLFESFRPKETLHITGTVVDEITDSFYPIAWVSAGSGTATGHNVLVHGGEKDWVQLQVGDWISLEGRFTAPGTPEAAGQLLQKSDGTLYFQWSNANLTDPYANTDPDRIAWVTAGTGSSSGRTVIGSDGARDWILLNAGDWITQEGAYYPGTPSYFNRRNYGQVAESGGAYSINWGSSANGNSRLTYTSAYDWHGTFYVKAKEDFIGGNAIDTNKAASVTTDNAVKVLPIPTVNVRLLDMNEMHSEVTVYLGDLINGPDSAPLDSLRYFYENTRFAKLIAGGGDMLNRFDPQADGLDGLEEAVFYLRYALGRDLTAEEWTVLAEGGEITAPYTYDDASSHGTVGYFTFRLEKGEDDDYGLHRATEACQPDGQPLTENCGDPVETYILNVTYTAYELNENGRPPGNVHNGSGSPGTEVGTGGALETGLGVVDKINVHEVHVISGTIEITKKFAEGCTAEEDVTFAFTLHRVEDGEDTSRDVTKTVTIPAGASVGSASITFTGLPRGTYTVTEAADEFYTVKDILVLNSTNCFSTPAIGETAREITFVMGHNPANENVIAIAGSDRYTSYVDPVNGVFGAAEFTNQEIVYTGEIPVEKIWSDDMALHETDAVFLVLYLDGNPVLDADGNAKLLKVDASTDWKGTFTVALANKDDLVTNHNYSVREVARIADAVIPDWTPAILENDGTLLWYEKTLDAGGQLSIENRGYIAEYTPGENGAWTVTNHRTVELPKTGGIGTHLYMFSGTLLMAAALTIGCSQRRKREGGAEE